MTVKLIKTGLIPGATYNVSLSLRKGDNEINTLRSFTVTVPKLFTGELSLYDLSANIRSSNSVTPVNDTFNDPISGTATIDKISWSIKGSFSNTSATPYCSFSIHFKNKAGFTNASLSTNIAPGGSTDEAAEARAIYNYVVASGSGSWTTSSSKISGKIPLNHAVFGGSSNFYVSSGKWKRASGKNLPWIKKASTPYFWKHWGKSGSYKFAKLNYTIGSRTVNITPDIHSVGKTLTASISPALISKLSNTEQVRDKVFWLYSDADYQPLSIDDSSWIFLDFGFTQAQGLAPEASKKAWTPATGQPIFINTGNYYKPIIGTDFLQSDIDNMKENNAIIKDIEIFSNLNLSQDGVAGVAVPSGTEESPPYVHLAYVVVRFIKGADGTWSTDSDWFSLDSSGKPSISRIITVGL